MKKILAPTDFSGNSYAAILYASKLYANEEVEFTLLHSFEEEVSHLTSRVNYGRSEEILKTLDANSEEEGKGMLSKLAEEINAPHHKYRMLSTPTALPKAINQMIEEDGYDLVVMGSKGRTGAEGILMGSTTEKVTELIDDCALLIVPNEIYYLVPTRVAFASDYNEFFSISKFKPITRLVRHHGSEIHLVHVGNQEDLKEEQLQNLERFRNDLSEYDTDFHFIPKEGNISGTLHSFVDNHTIDLLTLIYHRHAFLKKLFREPVVNRVGQHKNIPTLVIPQNYNV